MAVNVLIKFIKFVEILIRYKKYSINFIWHLLQLDKLEVIRMVASALKIYFQCIYTLKKYPFSSDLQIKSIPGLAKNHDIIEMMQKVYHFFH